MKRIVAVTSGKGGTGKSTFSINLGIAAAKNNAPVLLIDMDAGMRCLDMLLGVSESVLMDAADVVNGADAESSVLAVPGHDGLFLLPAPSETGLIDADRFGSFIDSIADRYSLVIIDFPAGSDFALYEKLPAGTWFVCVCNPDPVSVRDAAAAGRTLRSMNKKGYLVINKYSYRYISNCMFKNLDDILDETGLRLLGIVPLSDRFVYAFSTGDFPKRGRESKAFTRIAGRIYGKNVPLPKLKKI